MIKALVAMCALLAAASAWSADEPALKPWQDKVESTTVGLRKARLAQTAAAASANSAEKNLLEAAPGNRPAAADAAAIAFDALDAAENSVRAARRALARAANEVLATKDELAHCRAQGSACDRDKLLARLTERVMREDVASMAAAASAAELTPAKLVARAAKAQAAADDVTGKVDSAFKVGDGAVATAFTRASEGEPGSVPNARLAFDEAARAYQSAGGVQSVANELVRSAFSLADCVKANGRCPQADVDRVRAAVARLDTKSALVVKSHAEAVLAGRHVQVAEYDPQRQAEVVAFLSFLEKHPDATSLFGAEGFRLSASKEGTKAAIKIDLDKLKTNMLQDTSLTIETQGAADGAAFLPQAEGLTGDTRLRFSASFMRGFHALGEIQRYRVWGFDASVAQRKHSWVEAADLDKKLTRTTAPWALGIHLAVSGEDPGKELHVARLGFKSEYEDATKSTVCPLLPKGNELLLRCASASVGAPKVLQSRSVSYEFRHRAANYAIAPSFVFNDETGLKELKFPIYLLFNTDKTRAFTGGITFERKSRLRKEPESKSSTTFGVFIGGPLSFYAIDRTAD